MEINFQICFQILRLVVTAALPAGGLLSMHVLLTRNSAIMPDYSGGLLRLATDLGERLLPAFDTPTGIPLSWVNLRKVIVRRHKLLWGNNGCKIYLTF